MFDKDKKEPTFSRSRFRDCFDAILLTCSSDLLFHVVFSFSFSSISQVVFQFLDCKEITPDVSVMSSIPAIRCYKGSWNNLLPLIVVLLILFVILSPLYMLAWLYHRRKYGALYWC